MRSSSSGRPAVMNELKPGHVLRVSRAGLREERYWALEARPHEDSLETTIAKVRELLEDIVPRQMISDVPLGEGCFDLKRMISSLKKAKPNLRMVLELITRDPLKVPCLSEPYWATFPGVAGTDLVRTLKIDKTRLDVDVTIGVQQPERVDLEAVKKSLPIGNVTVRAVKGGLDVDDADAAGNGPAAVSSGLVSCVLAPEQTEGPYYVDDAAVRQALASDLQAWTMSQRGSPSVPPPMC